MNILAKLAEIFGTDEKTLAAIQNSNIPPVCKLIDAAGLTKYVVDCGIARGLDYYTNIVFEIDVPALGEEKTGLRWGTVQQINWRIRRRRDFRNRICIWIG